MSENITVHGNPEESVFGLLGSDVVTDGGKLYIKVGDDSKNIGWKEIPPTPSITQTISVTPTKTIIVTRTPTPTKSPFLTPTPTLTVTPSITPSLPPGTTRTPTPTPTATSFRNYTTYTLTSDTGATAVRVDGSYPSGTITLNTSMQLQLINIIGEHHLVEWAAPESVAFLDFAGKNLFNPRVMVTTLTPVIIKAVIGSGYLPTYRVDIKADINGGASFIYINKFGEAISFSAPSGTYCGGQLIFDAVCVNRIIYIFTGEVYVKNYSPC